MHHNPNIDIFRQSSRKAPQEIKQNTQKTTPKPSKCLHLNYTNYSKFGTSISQIFLKFLGRTSAKKAGQGERISQASTDRIRGNSETGPKRHFCKNTLY